MHNYNRYLKYYVLVLQTVPTFTTKVANFYATLLTADFITSEKLKMIIILNSLLL